jgi:transcriptional regulator GlxA family with amidase domain
MSRNGELVIGIPVYDGVDLMDVAVPWELFSWMAQIEADEPAGGRRKVVRLISADGPTVTTRDRMRLQADLGFDDSPALDVLWTPGGDPQRLQSLMQDARFMGFLQRQARQARYVTSVCEGALLLAAAGLLDGYRATTHWAFIACLARFPKIRIAEGYPRYVVDRNRVTGGGVSSGLDEGLEMVSLLSGETVARKVQLSVQYRPDPPFDDGDPSTAKPPIYNPGDGSRCAIPGMAETIDKIVECRKREEAHP